MACERLGDLEIDAGRLDRARVHYGDVLAIRQRLADADPHNGWWQYDLAFALLQLAQIDHATGRRDEPCSALRRTAAILAPLVEAEPDNQTFAQMFEFVQDELAIMA